MTSKSHTTNPPIAARGNVLAFETPQKQVDKERYDACRAFNALYAKYLRARASSISSETETACEKACDRMDEATWRIIHTPAPTRLHLAYKFAIMRAIVEISFADGRTSALLESIRTDTEGAWT
jgi:hypothetical protein